MTTQLDFVSPAQEDARAAPDAAQRRARNTHAPSRRPRTTEREQLDLFGSDADAAVHREAGEHTTR